MGRVFSPCRVSRENTSQPKRPKANPASQPGTQDPSHPQRPPQLPRPRAQQDVTPTPAPTKLRRSRGLAPQTWEGFSCACAHLPAVGGAGAVGTPHRRLPVTRPTSSQFSLPLDLIAAGPSPQGKKERKQKRLVFLVFIRQGCLCLFKKLNSPGGNAKLCSQFGKRCRTTSKD